MFFSRLGLTPDDSDDPDAAAAFEQWQLDQQSHQRPDNEVAGTVAVDAVVTRSPDAAAVLDRLDVHSNGVMVHLRVLQRTDPDASADPYMASVVGVVIGVDLPDGTVVVGGDGYSPASRTGSTLSPRGGGGGGRETSWSWWLTPAPGPGDLTVHVASVRLGLPEGSVLVEAEKLEAARGRIERLWPREPDRPYPNPALVAPEVPSGGWFERALEAGDPA
ncbi:MAG: hypothetical protein HGA44_06605 [Cellulomonadaceae bacterium]|nr:hypothetical protein [Cellulomonadaceae bacterium]